jgi:hypothetical protein
MLRALGGPGGVALAHVAPPLAVRRNAKQVTVPQRTSPITKPTAGVAKLAAWARKPMLWGSVEVVVETVVSDGTVVLVVGGLVVLIGALVGVTNVVVVVVVVVVLEGVASGAGELQPANITVTAAAIPRPATTRRTHAPTGRCASAS